MTGVGAAVILSLSVLLAGAAVFLRFRAVEQRIMQIEESLGAFSSLGKGDSPASAEDILQHLLAYNNSLIEDLKTPAEQPTPGGPRET